MEGRCRKLEMPQAPEDFYKDKNKKRHNRLWHFLRKESKLQWPL